MIKPYKNTYKTQKKDGINTVSDKIAEDYQAVKAVTGLPAWAVVSIAIVAAIAAVCVVLCLCKKCCCKKRKKKKDQKLKAQVDLNAVKDLDPAKVADKVQPDLEECDGPKLHGTDDKKTDLGRLQFSLGMFCFFYQWTCIN